MPPKSQPGPLPNWDPLLIVSQIISIQTIHYIALCILIPPSLATFADREGLEWEGGAASVGMIMDWRNIAGRRTSSISWGDGGWVWSAGRRVEVAGDDGGWHVDPVRGWVLSVCWLLACAIDTFWIYTLIRRPRLVLDFACTLLFVHTLLTSYYSSSFPTSLYWWGVMAAGTIGIVVTAEQLCVWREMHVGLEVDAEENDLEGAEHSDEDGPESMEMGRLPPRTD